MTGASTASIVSYSLVDNGTPRTFLLSQFNGEKHLLHKHDGPNAPDKSSAVHACDHRTTTTHFPIPEVIMDNIIHRTTTHVQFYGNFIHSYSPVVTARSAVSLSQLPS